MLSVTVMLMVPAEYDALHEIWERMSRSQSPPLVASSHCRAIDDPPVETLVTWPPEPSVLSMKLPVRTTEGHPHELAAEKVTARLELPLQEPVGDAVENDAETLEKPSSMLPSQSVS